LGKSQYYINKHWHGLCGQVAVAAILQGFGIDISANNVVERYIDAVNRGQIEHPDEPDKDPMPNYTGPGQLTEILRIMYGDLVDIPSDNVYTSGYGMDWRNKNWGSQLRKLLGQGYVILACVFIDDTGRVTDGANIAHWVAITGMSYQWNYGSSSESERSPWNWVRIYNPFDNQPEYYWFGDFKDSWSANGNMMFPVRIKSRERGPKPVLPVPQ